MHYYEHFIVVIPKSVGRACYLLIIYSVFVLILTLAATQDIALLYFSYHNALGLQAQILLSLLNCLMTVGCVVAILKGHVLGRQIWHIWTVALFFLNAWQLHDRLYLLPLALVMMFSLVMLYSKPAQAFFAEKQKTKVPGKRVDNTFNIFDD